MIKVENIYTGKISYVDNNDWTNKSNTINIYKISKDKELKNDLLEVK